VFSFQPFNFSKVANFSWKKKFIAIHQNRGFFQKVSQNRKKIARRKKIQ
jgi:hypothetical protein